MNEETMNLIWGMLSKEQKEELWNAVTDEQMEMLWKTLSDEQLMEIRENGAMNQKTMQSFKTELMLRCLIELDEAFAPFFGW